MDWLCLAQGVGEVVCNETCRSIIISKISECYSFFLREISECYYFITNYKEIIKNLEKEYDKLNLEKDDIDGGVGSEQDNLREIEDTNKWLENVKKLMEDDELQKLLDPGKRKGRDKCCFQRFRCNLIQRYQMSKTAEVKVGEIKSAIEGKPKSRRDSRKKLMEDILKMLQNDNVDAVGIHGMGAIGKTTLAKRIANKEGKDVFDEIVMVEISDVPNVKRIQDQIAEQLDLKINYLHNIEERARRIYYRLLKEVKSKKGKGAIKILIILDNVWKKLDLDKVGIPQPFDNTENFKCKFLVTSRESNVCEAMGVLSANIHSVKPLEDDEAKKLFREKVGKKSFDDDTRQEAVEKRLLKKCGGLPLTIVALANVLKNIESLSMWEHYANELEKSTTSSLAKISDVHRQTYSILETSYERIESEEKKRFFLLACLFPSGASIPVEDLIRFGIGLYLFENVDELREAKALGNGWIDELKSSALLLEDDREGHVKIHDVIRASRASQKGEDMIMVEAFPRWMSSETCQKYYAISLMWGTDHSRLHGLISDKLQILILDNTRPRDQFGDDFFQGMTNLKVLVLKGMKFVPSLPKSIGKLKMSLRTLHMEDCKLGDIAGICELTNLLVLSLRESTMDELPKDLGNLCKLRLLDLNDCQIMSNEIPANVLSKLSHLEGLYAFAGGLYTRDYFGRSWRMLRYNNNNDLEEGVISTGGGPKDICEKSSIFAELDNLVYLKVLHLRLKFQHVPVHLAHQFVKGLDQFYISLGGPEDPYGYKSRAQSSRFFRLHDINNLRSIVEYNLMIRELLKKTEMLLVTDMEELQNIFHDKDEFQNLQHLSVNMCKNMKFIFLEHGQLNNAEFPNLKQMTLDQLPELESVIGTMKCSTDEDQQGLPVLFNSKMTFPSLEELTLSWCDKIVQLWEVNCKQMTYYSSFTNLQKIDIKWCNELEVFCSHSIATALVHLKELTIENCPQLKDVISSSKDETDIPKFGDQIFPSLEKVFLHDCPKLQMFIAGNKTQQVVELSSLQALKINECPEMKSFASGPFKAPKLTQFEFDGTEHSEIQRLQFLQFLEDRFQKARNPSKKMDPNQRRPTNNQGYEGVPQNFSNLDPSLTSHPQFHSFLQAMGGNSSNVPPNFQNYNLPPPNFINNYPFPPNFQNYYPPSQNFDTQETTPNQGSNSETPICEDEEEEDDDDDDEIVPETQPPLATEPILSHPLPYRSTQQNVRLSKQNWTHREDEALIACYMEHCTDQTISTNQTASALWRKVTASYTAAHASRQNELRPRTLCMIKSRWRRMSSETMKWVGCYEEAKRMMSSGEQETDVVGHAKILFSRSGGKNYSFEHAWSMLSKYSKWKERIARFIGKNKDDVPTASGPCSGGSNSSGKRVRLNDEDEIGTDNYMSGGLRRPDGVKKAKGKRFGKGGSSSDEVATRLGDSLQAFCGVRGKDMNIKHEKLEIERLKERSRQKQIEVEERNVQLQETKMKWDMLQHLESKNSLTPQEEKFKQKLSREIYGD